jgi:hypothetical protein
VKVASKDLSDLLLLPATTVNLMLLSSKKLANPVRLMEVSVVSVSSISTSENGP